MKNLIVFKDPEQGADAEESAEDQGGVFHPSKPPFKPSTTINP